MFARQIRLAHFETYTDPGIIIFALCIGNSVMFEPLQTIYSPEDETERRPVINGKPVIYSLSNEVLDADHILE